MGIARSCLDGDKYLKDDIMPNTYYKFDVKRSWHNNQFKVNVFYGDEKKRELFLWVHKDGDLSINFPICST